MGSVSPNSSRMALTTPHMCFTLSVGVEKTPVVSATQLRPLSATRLMILVTVWGWRVLWVMWDCIIGVAQNLQWYLQLVSRLRNACSGQWSRLSTCFAG